MSLVELGALLRQRMEKMKWTQNKLASEVRVSQGYVSKLLKGGQGMTIPRPEVLTRLAHALDIDLEQVYSTVGLEVPKTVKRPVIIGISGGSGAGKTWLAHKLQAWGGKDVAVIELDGYYKEKEEVERQEDKFDNPASIDFVQVFSDLDCLKQGKGKAIPRYDFIKEQSKLEMQLPCPLIVIEGHLLFHDKKTRSLLNICIWVEAGDGIRVERRIKRDVQERGRSLNEILKRYDEEVRPAYHRYVHPLRRFADIIMLNDDNNPNNMSRVIPMILAYVQSLPFAQSVSWSLIPPDPEETNAK